MSLAEKSPAQSLGNLVDRLIVAGVAKDLHRFIRSVPVDFPDEFTEQYEKKIRAETRGVTPVLVSSHTSHMDGLPLASVTRTITMIHNGIFDEERLKGFIIPVASSMESGHQGSIVKEGIDKMRETIRLEYCLEAVPYTREKDTEKYGLTENRLKSMLYFIRRIREGYGFAVFPEATMQAGRTRKKELFVKSQRFGMQEFKDMEELTKIVQAAGKVPLYIPVGINGGFRLESPDNNRPTLPYLAEVFLTRPGQTRLVSVRVGLPITYSEVGFADINRSLGEKVALLLPEEVRGVYA